MTSENKKYRRESSATVGRSAGVRNHSVEMRTTKMQKIEFLMAMILGPMAKELIQKFIFVSCPAFCFTVQPWRIRLSARTWPSQG